MSKVIKIDAIVQPAYEAGQGMESSEPTATTVFEPLPIPPAL